jgi:acyl carrier protein
MDKKAFILRLQEDLELEEQLSETTCLKELEDWDSMTAMVLIGIVHEEFSVSLNADDIESMTDIESLMAKIGFDKFN